MSATPPDNEVTAAAGAAAGEERPRRDEAIVERLRELMAKYPTIGSRQLYDFAVRQHPELEEPGFRSFHARYVLPLKRAKAREEGRPPKRRGSASKPAPARRRRGQRAASDAEQDAAASALDTAQVRARVRDVMLRLARQVAVAESRADLVDALSGVESMVDEVLAALQPPATDDGDTSGDAVE